MDTLPERLKAIRGSLSQAAFARHLNMPQTTWSNYENAKSKPDYALIDELCSLFNLNLEWLLFGRGPMHQGEEAAPQEPVSVPVVAPAQTVCAQCLALYAKLETANERLYEAMRENSELKETIGNLREELAIIKNAQYEEDDEDEGEDTPLANVS